MSSGSDRCGKGRRGLAGFRESEKKRTDSHPGGQSSLSRPSSMPPTTRASRATAGAREAGGTARPPTSRHRRRGARRLPPSAGRGFDAGGARHHAAAQRDEDPGAEGHGVHDLAHDAPHRAQGAAPLPQAAAGELRRARGVLQVEWIGRSHESLLQRASSGRTWSSGERCSSSAGDILWLHSFYGPLNASWQPGGCAPGGGRPAARRGAAAEAAAGGGARGALGGGVVKSATVESIRDAIERAKGPTCPSSRARRRGRPRTGGGVRRGARQAGAAAQAAVGAAAVARAGHARAAGGVCPVTREVMRHPVVASDGHSYERDALKEVLERDGRSLTRELLQPFFFPNHNLKKRIRECAPPPLARAACATAAAHVPAGAGAGRRGERGARGGGPCACVASISPPPSHSPAQTGEAERFAVCGQKAMRTSRRGGRVVVPASPGTAADRTGPAF